MAVTLTTSWQNVANSTWQPGSGFSVTFYLDAKYSTQSTINNNTTVQTRLRSVVNSGYGSGYNYSFSCSYAGTVSGSGSWTLETETITSGESTITHNQDGTKTITLSANARINGISMNVSFSGDAILPRINRYATLVSAPDFNDEADPKITFTKNVASGATVYAGIFNSTGTTVYASYRDISSSVINGEYTFSLNNTERTALRNASSNSNTLQVQFKLYTTISSTNYDGGTLTKTMTIVNAKPTIDNITYSEQNAKVSALLGSSGNTVVQNASTLRIGVSTTALKNSTISKVEVVHSGSTYTDTSSPYSLDVPVKSNSFTIKSTSSRPSPNDTTSQTITKTIIEYKPVAINSLTFKRQTETSGVILLSLDATYYQKTFGSTANAPIVKWKMGTGSWTTLTSSQYSIDTTNNKLTVSSLSLGNILNYESEATFYLYIEDKLSSVNDNRKVIRGQATLELGKDDVKVNNTLYVAKNIAIPKNSTAGYGLTNSDGASIIRDWNNTNVVVDATNGTLYLGYNNTTGINLMHDKAQIESTGAIKATNGIYSLATGQVATATNANSMLLIKRATSSEAPNNGVVLEFGNSTNYKGQLYIGDNATQGIYYNGWSNGTRGSWRRLNEVGVSLYDNTTGTTGTVNLSQTSANFTYLEIHFRTNDNYYASVRVFSPNSKIAFLCNSYMYNTGGSLKLKTVTISGTSITKKTAWEYSLGSRTFSSTDYVYITKVVGYYN